MRSAGALCIGDMRGDVIGRGSGKREGDKTMDGMDSEAARDELLSGGPARGEQAICICARDEVNACA